MKYKTWTSAEEQIIREAYKYGRRKGIVESLCVSLDVNRSQLKAHLRKMKEGGRL